MKGFGIYVKNNLLEPKHIENMGGAVWLYMWLLDKMTSVNENGVGRVLGGQPITHGMVVADLGIEERQYQRWLKRLRDADYIRTLRTAYGQVITINKAEKIFKKSNDKTVVLKKAKTQNDKNVLSETTKMADLSDKNGRSNKDNTNNNTNKPTNVGLQRGNPAINQMFVFWSQEVGFDIESRVQANRYACNNLLKKFGEDKLKQLILGVALTHSDPYAPRIADFSDLQAKVNQLVVWGKRKHGEEIDTASRTLHL